jgi:hypothetical protein
MSGFLPVPDSSGFDKPDDVEDASATIRVLRDSFERVTGPDDLMCYQLNPRTKLYRADTERLKNGANPGIATDYLPVSGPVFFGFAESSLDQYGIVAEYEVLHPIQSIALDDPVTLNKLHEDCVIEDIKKILRENYGAGKPSAVRNSVKPNDFKLINYLIDTYGIGGTVFLASVYREGGSFHPEIALPQIQVQSDFLRINGIVTDPTEIPGKIAAYDNRVNAPKKVEQNPIALDGSPVTSYRSLIASPMATPMATPMASHTQMASPMASYTPMASPMATPSANHKASHTTYKTGGPIISKTSKFKNSDHNYSDHNYSKKSVIKKLSFGGALRKSSKKTKSKKAKRAKKSQRRRR